MELEDLFSVVFRTVARQVIGNEIQYQSRLLTNIHKLLKIDKMQTKPQQALIFNANRF